MKFVALFLIRLYQLCKGPFLVGGTCRFAPSCSEYAYQAFSKYGFFKGFKLMIVRLSKCHPWHPGGCDEVP